MLAEPHRNRAAVTDAFCLAAITVLSALPYVAGLGFYSDDWALLVAFQAAADSGKWILAEMAGSYDSRPVQAVYHFFLFKLFGFSPLGHHLVNTAVIAASVVLLYLLLIRLAFGRAESFAAALIFALLPQLSTVRMWFAAFQVPLALALMLIAMHALLSFARGGKLPWLAVSVAAAVLSFGAYEIFAPLMVAFAAGVGWAGFRGSPRKAIAAFALIAAVAIVGGAKLLLSTRTGPPASVERYMQGAIQFFRTDYDWRVDTSLNAIAALDVHFWQAVRGWASATTGLLGADFTPLAAGAALAIAAVACWRLASAARGDLAQPRPGQMALLGLAAFILGHAAFLIVPWIIFSPSGVANRVLPAAAIGVALILAAALSFFLRPGPTAASRTAFAAAVSLVAFAAFARIEQIGRFWAEAPALQSAVLKAAQADLRAIPAGSTVILDGVCPYHGPAIVFEAGWDVGPALSRAVEKPLTGDAVSRRTVLTSGGLVTSIYETPTLYPYGPALFVYNPRLRQVVQLRDSAQARRYFQRSDRSADCPDYYVGHGVLI